MPNYPIHQGTLFEGLPINTKYPLVKRYLEQIHKVLNNALAEHPRSLIFHVVLRLPADIERGINQERLITRFIEAFKQRVVRNLVRKRKTVERVHNTSVRYVWCREQESSSHQHYHVFFLLNGQTFRQLGSFKYENKDHLRYMITDSWAKVTGVTINENKGLVHFPGEPKMLNVREFGASSTYCQYIGREVNLYESAFHWMSYLAKVDTKQYRGGWRCFGCSLT